MSIIIHPLIKHKKEKKDNKASRERKENPPRFLLIEAQFQFSGALHNQLVKLNYCLEKPNMHNSKFLNNPIH